MFCTFSAHVISLISQMSATVYFNPLINPQVINLIADNYLLCMLLLTNCLLKLQTTFWNILITQLLVLRELFTHFWKVFLKLIIMWTLWNLGLPFCVEIIKRTLTILHTVWEWMSSLSYNLIHQQTKQLSR